MAERSFAYLVITPSPINGNYIVGNGGLEIYNHDGKKKAGTVNVAEAHYVKIGHQKEIAGRVKAYDTHAPSMWFRHIVINTPLNDDEKKEQLKDGTPGSSANFIEKMMLTSNFPRDFHANEWYLTNGHTENLRDLCRKLDDEKEDFETKETHKKPVTHDQEEEEKEEKIEKIEKKLADQDLVDVNRFADEVDCIKKLKEWAGGANGPFKKITIK